MPQPYHQPSRAHICAVNWPTLSFDWQDTSERAWKRLTALETPGERVPRLLSRDEYPFACTLEHAGSVWVGHVPAAQNSRQGGKIAAFLGTHGAYAGKTNCTSGFRFIARVVNHPLGSHTPERG